jgi:hypothetical protein
MKKYLIILAAIPAILSSCLKDKNLTDKQYGLLGVDEIKVVQIQEAPQKNAVFNVSTTPLTVTALTVSTGIDVLNDVTVTLVKDDALVIAAGDSVLPASKYTIASLSVTIPKGKRSATLPITIGNTAVLLGTSYALGFKIVSTSDASYGISTNYKTIVVPIVVQNEYAGMYDVTGGRYNYTGAVSYTYPGPLPAGSTFVGLSPTKEMFTVDANTSEIGVAGLVTLGYSYRVTVPPGSTGSSDIICPTTFTPLFLSDNSGIELKLSTYNPATKTFNFVLRYLNGSGNARIMVEKFVKQ